MLCHNSNHCGHRNCEQKFTKISANNTRTTLNRFPTKTAILGISHTIRKALQAETWGLSGGVQHYLKSRSTREERKQEIIITIIIIIINFSHPFFVLKNSWSHAHVQSSTVMNIPQDKHILTVRAHRAFCETLLARTTSDRETHYSFNLSQDGSALHYERLVIAEI
jgi:hypothetical protein